MENQNNSLIILAVGGGAINIANFINKTAIKGSNSNNINLFAIDTDEETLQSSDVANKILVRNLSTADDIESQLEPHLKGVKIAVIIAALGGRTGTTLAPQILKILHTHTITSLCIVTTPFLFEGENITTRALDSITKMAAYNPVIVKLENEYLKREMSDQPISVALQFFDEKIANLVFALNEASAQHQPSVIARLQEGKELGVNDITSLVKMVLNHT
jgi:cell division protein FtsZ